MAERADAHIHLFEGGFQGGSLAARPGVQLDEGALYASLAQEHGIAAALIVGYEGAPWCARNNEYIARMAKRYAWARPVAFVRPSEPPTLAELAAWRERGFVGISLYLIDQATTEVLARVPDEVWAWIAAHHWLVSVNSRGPLWAAWPPILERHPTLSLLASHLGLPQRARHPLEHDAARGALAHVLPLARFPGVHVKLSGFYALTEPGYDYPHRAAWPYVEALLEAFGPARLLWASDYTPCLDWVSFPQACHVLERMSFLGSAERERIEGVNLLALLEQAARG